MKYRIKEKNGRYYPQFKVWWNWYVWANFQERWSVVHPLDTGMILVIIQANDPYTTMFTKTLAEADAYLAKKKKEKEVNIYVR